MKLKLIEKSVIVSELEKRIEETKGMQPKFDQFWAGQISAFKGVLKILDTLEVKEVEEPSKDLEEAADTYVKVWYKIHDLDAESYPIDVKISKTDFIAGAKWYKEQLKRLKEESV